ncbi:MAG: hypothetical protein PHD02_04265 [Bacilli bacterium]|nr:hypothetical protein [Bacilli bacterium]
MASNLRFLKECRKLVYSCSDEVRNYYCIFFCTDFDSSIQKKYDDILKQALEGKDLSLIDAVSIIRTIFRNFGEQTISIQIKKETQIEEVKYGFGRLTYYKLKGDNIAILYQDHEAVRDSINGDEHTKDRLEYRLSAYLKRLSGVKPISFEERMSKVCFIYYWFYKSIPDFSSTSERKKANFLFLLLSKIGIIIDGNIVFERIDHDHFESSYLNGIINKIACLSFVEPVDEMNCICSSLDKYKPILLRLSEVVSEVLSLKTGTDEIIRLLYLNKLSVDDMVDDPIANFHRLFGNQLTKKGENAKISSSSDDE